MSLSGLDLPSALVSSPSDLLCLSSKLVLVLADPANPGCDSTSVVRVKPEPKMRPLYALKGDDPMVRGPLGGPSGLCLRDPKTIWNRGFTVIKHAHITAKFISTVDQFAMEV